MTIRIQNTDWVNHRDLLSGIRHTVFVEEQRVPVELEVDDLDPKARHFIVFDGDSAIATARLLDDGCIGRMAVLRDYRANGIGLALLNHIIATARQQGFDSLYLSSQEHALAFYARSGFVPLGETFVDAGIPHRAMTLSLTSGPRQVVSIENFAHAAFTAASQSRRRLRIFSYSLEANVFADKLLAAMISRLCRRHRSTGVEILVCDDAPLREGFHPLVELSQKLSSSIEIRVIDSAYTSETKHYSVIADDKAIFAYGRQADSPAWMALDSPALTREPLETFNRMWSMGQPTPWLRRLP